MRLCDSTNIITVSNLGNAREMNEQFPRLNIPNYQMISAIEPDDWVQLTHEGDRFWVTVDEVTIDDNHCTFVGKVQGELSYSHPFKEGDCIYFAGLNILNIHSREWKDELRISPNEIQ
jgi:hypothetical protein